MEEENKITEEAVEETKPKTEEEIRAEVRAELEHEQEIKDQAKREVEREELKKEEKKANRKRRKRSIGRLIWNIISTAIVLAIIFFTVMGLLDMQRLNNNEEPYWYISMKTEDIDNKKVTTYDLALYEIIKEEGNSEKKLTLRPFFLKYFENKNEANDTKITTTTKKK